MNPKIKDVFAVGGISAGLSGNSVIDLRPFPRIREMLVDGVPACFFIADPIAFINPPLREPCGPFDTSGGTIFGRPFFVATDSLPALGDWDGDGDLDLFVAYREGPTGRVRVFENRGSPVVPNLEERPALAIAIAALIGGGNSKPRLAFADTNSDGKAELVIGGETGTLRIVGSDGRFDGLTPAFDTTLAIGGTRALPALGGTNADGRADLMVVGDDGKVQQFLNSGAISGSPFSGAASTDLLGTAVPLATAVSVADIDEDGRPDIVISDNAGSQWEFHKAASGPTYSLVSKIYAGAYDGYASGLSTTLGDFDGDGDTDVIAGFAAGGLMYLRNQAAKLTIDPPAKTLTNGSTVDLNLRCDAPEACPPGTLTWRFVAQRSGSGSSLDPVSGLYQAGSSPGAVDVVESVLTFTDGSKRIGRAYLNVISPTQTTQVARALIVTGRRVGNDSIWEAVNNAGNLAYKTLRYRGLPKADIHYLSAVPNQDVDGDGVLNDIQGRSEKQAVLDAINSLSQGTDRLYVILIDHGVQNGAVTDFILNEDGNAQSRLSPADLAGALNTFQGSGQGNGKDVVLMLDFCYAGGFLPALSHSYGPNTLRVVTSAALANQTVQMPARGLLSFSSYWLGAGYQGFDLEHTFNLARSSMESSVPRIGSPAAPVQQPQLDDDGSGAQSSVDGAAARQLTLGRSFVVGQDIPIIDEVSPDQILGGARAEALITIGKVTSVHPINRAFCSVSDAAAGIDPVVNQPSFELEYNRSTQKYEALVGGFTRINQPYQLSCYVQDVWGSTSYPSPSQVTATQYDQRLLIVVGEATGATPRQAEANAIGNAVWRTARARGYAADKIRYLNPQTNQDLDGSPGSEVSASPSIAQLSQSVNTWAADANELTVVLISGGSDGSLGFDLQPLERRTGTELQALFYPWQDAPNNSALRGRPLNLILEFNRSGSMLPALAPSGAQVHHSRVVIASTGASVGSLMAGQGVISYTQMALSQYLLGRSYGIGHSNTATALGDASRLLGAAVQVPLIDVQRPDLVGKANYQPGIGNDSVDRRETQLRYFGSIGAVSLPLVTSSIAPVVIGNGEPVRIWAQVQAGTRGIDKVYGIPVPPIVGMPAPAEIPLSWNPGTQRYEATSSAFSGTGDGSGTATWNLIVYAKEQPNPLNPIGDPGSLSPPYTAVIKVNSVDPAVRFTTASQIVTEPPNGQTVNIQMPIELTRTTGTAIPVSVIVNGNARNLDDFTLDTTVVSFGAGATAGTRRTLILTVRGDNAAEGSEAVILSLAPQGAAVGAPNVYTVTINPRDPSPVVFANGFE